MKYTTEDINALDNKHRALFINSLSGFKSANLVGTANKDKQSNLAIVSSVVHLGANPPLLGMVMRPHTVPRGTLENILETGEYTLNHVNEEIYKKAHQTSARYPDNVSEFDEVGLTEQWFTKQGNTEQGLAEGLQEFFAAPFVEESIIKLGMKFRERHALDINGTEFIIGEIVSIEMPDDLVSEDGFVSLEQAGTVAVSSLDTYHSTNVLGSLSYAKPDKQTSLLPRDHTSHLSIVEARGKPNNAETDVPKCVLVVAASGGIGKAFCEQVLKKYPDVQLIRMARDINNLAALDGNIVDIQIDLGDDGSIDNIDNAISTLTEKYTDIASQPNIGCAAKNLKIDWVFCASGWLHDKNTKPEKTHRSLSREHLLHSYNINAVGPVLLVSRLLTVTDKKHPMKVGLLSARVGSVSDNRLGGWHSYRASKSALHMLIKNISIEANNSHKGLTIVGLQPGTTDTHLSSPFQKGLSEAQLQTPEFTATHLIQVMQVLEKGDSGKLFDFEGLAFEP